MCVLSWKNYVLVLLRRWLARRANIFFSFLLRWREEKKIEARRGEESQRGVSDRRGICKIYFLVNKPPPRELWVSFASKFFHEKTEKLKGWNFFFSLFALAAAWPLSCLQVEVEVLLRRKFSVFFSSSCFAAVCFGFFFFLATVVVSISKMEYSWQKCLNQPGECYNHTFYWDFPPMGPPNSLPINSRFYWLSLLSSRLFALSHSRRRRRIGRGWGDKALSWFSRWIMTFFFAAAAALNDWFRRDRKMNESVLLGNLGSN